MAAKKHTKNGGDRKLPAGLWKRGSTYYARFRSNGRLVRKKLSSDYRVACELLRDLQSRADRADFGVIDNAVQIADIRDQWLRYCDQTLRPSSVERYRENMANIGQGIPARTVSQINVGSLMQYRAARLAAGASPRTVNMEVGALSTMLTWAVQHGLIGSNPVRMLPGSGDRRRRSRWNGRHPRPAGILHHDRHGTRREAESHPGDRGARYVGHDNGRLRQGDISVET